MKPFQIENTFVALDDSCGARPLPVTENFWSDLQSGGLGDLSRLVSCFSFDKDWTSWEKHPMGEEFVYLLEGEVEFVLEKGGANSTVVLDRPGSYVLVPKDTWHTAKVRKPAKMLFITPGEGTQNKPV